MTRPTIRRGDQGSLVIDVQNCLLETADVDGDFGAQTEQAVRDYQEYEHISVDGVVGPMTWEHLDTDYELSPYPPALLPPLEPATAKKITDLAMQSPVADYNWSDRGMSPPGYTKGMALGYATLVRKLYVGDSAALDMAQADTGDDDKDALAWYADVYEDLEMDNDEDGLPTLRHLYCLLWGLGMRESSGRHCEGRDQSAENTSSTTAEAGLFQQSQNSSSCSTEIQKLLDEYMSNIGSQQCALDVFKEGVGCSSSEWACYGSDVGYDFQDTCKKCPQYAVEACLIGLRHLRQHWGPINEHAAEVNPYVDDLLIEIERVLAVSPDVPIEPDEPDDPLHHPAPKPPEVEEVPELPNLRAICISSGHGLKVRGAAGPSPWGLDEVDEARRVVSRVVELLEEAGGSVVEFHDNTSTTQSQNLSTITTFHNKQQRDLDVSIHFNCYDQTAHGVEVLYLTQEKLADKISKAIADAAGLTNRGPKYRGDLAFLNNTTKPAVLIETLFCDNQGDTDAYRSEFNAICEAIARSIAVI
jgi:N-acetylmuramoyl-L-alanine amidase